MVSYQRFTAIAFDVAESKGAQFQGIQDGGKFLSQLSDLWQANKDEYVQLTEQQTRNRLQEHIEA